MKLIHKTPSAIAEDGSEIPQSRGDYFKAFRRERQLLSKIDKPTIVDESIYSRRNYRALRYLLRGVLPYLKKRLVYPPDMVRIDRLFSYYEHQYKYVRMRNVPRKIGVQSYRGRHYDDSYDNESTESDIIISYVESTIVPSTCDYRTMLLPQKGGALPSGSYIESHRVTP